MNRLLALIPAALLLLHPELQTATARDLIVHAPLIGPTTATDNGVPVACDPALTINISTRFLPDGSVNWSVYPSLPGPNNYGPDWLAAVEEGSLYCGFTGCTNGRLGWHNVGGPLDTSDFDFGGLDLAPRVGRNVVIVRTGSATTLTILDPPSIFAILDAYFAGDLTLGQFFDAIADYFGGL
jgi:hypothetical protein